MADIESGRNIVDLQHVFCTFNDGLLFWKKISRYARQIFFKLTLVLTEKKILNETKNHNPPPPLPLQVKWSVPNVLKIDLKST